MANKFAVETIFKASDKVSKPMSKMRRSVSRFTHSLQRGFQRANKAINKLVTKMKEGFTVGAVALSAAVTGVAVAMKEVADRADDLSKQAKVLDMPIEDLQEWQFVAEQSGIEAGAFTKSLGILDRQVGQLKAGTGTLITIFKKTDPGFLKQLRNAKNTADALDLVIKKMRSLKDPTIRATLAATALGKQGLKAIVIAKTSAKEIAKLREEARKNGLITQKQATAAEAFNDKLNSLKHTFQGVLQEALLPLMPIATKYLNLLQQWVLAHKKLLALKIKNFVVDIGQFIQYLADNGAMILKVTEWIAGLVVGLKILTGVITVLDFVLTPVGAVITAIALLAVGIAYLIINWNKLKAAFENTAFGKAIIKMFSEISSIVDSVAKKIDNFLKPFYKNLNLGIDKLPAQSGTKAAFQMVSPQARLASLVQEQKTTQTATVTIKDDTNRAVVTDGALGSNISLIPSGAF